MKKLETRINDDLKLVELNQDKIQISKKSYHITKENEKLRICLGKDEWLIDEITQIGDDILRIELAGFTIDVSVNDPIDIAVGIGEEQIGEIIAPMSGIVSEIMVNVGDVVAEGDTLLIISAMKMENKIVSSSAGKIAMVFVVQNEQIEWGKILLKLE